MPISIDLYEAGAIDFARPAKEILFERFNAINGTSFNPDDFVLSQVVVQAAPTYNTKVDAIPVASSFWSNGFPIYYTRVHLQEQMQHVAEVKTNGETNLYSILDAVNAAYGLYLSEADVQDAVINFSVPGDLTSNGTVQIVTRATSIFFIGDITIPVNNTAIHGISTYDDELVHFLAVRPSVNNDTLIARDALGQPLSSFTFMKNYVWTSSKINQMFKKPDGSLVLLGDFKYKTPGGTNRTDKTLFISSRGVLLSRTAGGLYGQAYAGLQYIEAFEQERVYALDKQNTIGGTAHGIVAFTADGDVDPSFTSSLTSKVDNLVPYGNTIYVTWKEGNNTILRRLSQNGNLDTSFPKITVKLPSGRATDYGSAMAINVSADGVCLVMAPDGTPTPSWETYTNVPLDNGLAAPVVVHDHSGARIDVYSTPNLLKTNRRVGIGQTGSKIALTTHAVVYLARSVDIVTGISGMFPIAVNDEGVVTGAYNAANFDTYPNFTNYASIEASTRGDVIVGGDARIVVNGVVKQHAAVVAFDFHGNYAARLLAEPDVQLLFYRHHRFM